MVKKKDVYDRQGLRIRVRRSEKNRDRSRSFPRAKAPQARPGRLNL